MDKHGLTSSSKLDTHVGEISKEPIAVAVCRAMNDYRPIHEIIESLIDDSDEERIKRYAACALAQYCYRSGLYFPILSAAFKKNDITLQLRERDQLPLTYSDLDTKNYVVPTNPILGERVLREIGELRADLLFEVYCSVGAYVAPYVNRQTIRARTPEARLAQRLFNYDDAVIEFIPSHSEEFYIRMKRDWEWNSRYWEQFALLKLDKSLKSSGLDRVNLLSQAVSHARHAVKIERHPFTLTTLGRILLEQMKQISGKSQMAFNEAFSCLDEAIRWEGINNRIAIHPYMTLLSGARNFLMLSGQLSVQQSDALNAHLSNAEKLFSYDRRLLDVAEMVRSELSPPSA